MKRFRRMRFTILAAIVALAGFVIGLAYAFSDNQAITGTVTATAGGTDLYICEASESVAGPACAADDSGADEVIFEGLESLVPGATTQWDIRLKNVGTSRWDVSSAVPVVTIADDPGGDCGVQLEGDPALGFQAIIRHPPPAPVYPIDTARSLAVNESQNEIYVAAASDWSLNVIDGFTNIVVRGTGAGGTPSDPRSTAFNPATGRIYTAGLAGNYVQILDAVTLSSLGTLNVGINPSGIAINPITNRIYVIRAFNANTVTVYDGLTNGRITTITPPGNGYLSGIAVNPVTNKIYVTSEASDQLIVIDGLSNSPETTVPIGASPLAVAVNPVNNRVYVSDTSTNTVSVIDGSTNVEIDTDGNAGNGVTRIPVGVGPASMALDANRHLVFVANYDSGSISVIDDTNYSVIGSIPTGAGPLSVAVNRVTGIIYTADDRGNSVSVAAIGGANDNHQALLAEPEFSEIGGGASKAIHVEPGEYEDVRILVRMADEAPDGCADTAWNVSIDWVVEQHVP